MVTQRERRMNETEVKEFSDFPIGFDFRKMYFYTIIEQE